MLLVHDYDHPVSVSVYDPDDGTKKYRTVSEAIAWTHPQTSQVYMSVISYSIHVSHMQNHLLCPMLMCLNL